jgi:hypothetical protein
VGPPVFSWSCRGRGRVKVGALALSVLLLLLVSLLLVSDVPEVVDGSGGALISVVESFGVLVMVGVVVIAEDAAAVSEKDGSTKFTGASGGSSPPLTNITAATRTPMTAMPAAVAPMTARVELCHGCEGLSEPSTNSSSPDSSSRSGLVTATDNNPPTWDNTRSAELRHDLAGEKVEVIEVGHI